jgi:hypothetical protein
MNEDCVWPRVALLDELNRVTVLLIGLLTKCKALMMWVLVTICLTLI